MEIQIEGKNLFDAVTLLWYQAGHSIQIIFLFRLFVHPLT